jgi:carboxypeptidase Taq
MLQSERSYQNLLKLSQQARILTGISHLLDWDQETYMPPGAATIRGLQLATLAGLIHEQKTGKKFKTALAKLIDIPTGKILERDLSGEQQAALKQWRRDFVQEQALPKKFVADFAQLSSQSILAWREAKQSNSFLKFAPFLEKLIMMSRKKADYLGYPNHPYDALLDQYEPEATTQGVAILFTSLQKSITKLLGAISQAKQVDDSLLHGDFPEDKQISFAHLILKDMGYHLEHGRLDLSSHPFSSSSHPTDSRITTRIHPTSVMSCISVILHEAGHALYEMGLPKEHYGSPLGDAISLGVHESQSRWWETRIGQSKPFWHHYLPLLQKHFKGKFDQIDLPMFYRAINKVQPSLIRVDADEVTYPLHVILRFELERGLIEGSLKIRDIPDAWNAKMKELLGVVPQTDTQGCLQDIHWAMGGFGYFPTYTLGNLYASQLFESFEKKHQDWEKRVAKGELHFITQWLHEAVHRHGRRYSSQEILKQATGKKPISAPYIHYLESKYREIYQLK